MVNLLGRISFSGRYRHGRFSKFPRLQFQTLVPANQIVHLRSSVDKLPSVNLKYKQINNKQKHKIIQINDN